MPRAPAQGWHLSSLWTPQDPWALVDLPTVHEGCHVWEEGRGAPNLLSVESVLELLLETGRVHITPMLCLSSTEFNCISENGNARKAGCLLQIPASTYL